MALTVSSFIPTDASVRTRAADQLPFAFAARPQAMTIYLRFIEAGSVLNPSPAAPVRLLSIGGTATLNTGSLRIVGTGATTIVLNNGISSEVTSTAGGTPAVGQMVEIVGQLTATGAVQIIQSLGGGTATSSGLSSARVLPLVWSPQILWLNSRNTAAVGFVQFLDVVISRGVLDLSSMRRLARAA